MSVGAPQTTSQTPVPSLPMQRLRCLDCHHHPLDLEEVAVDCSGVKGR